MLADEYHMNITEKRKGDRLTIPLRDKVCFCKIELSNGFIGLEGKVVDVSSTGIRLQVSYQPTLLDVMQISPGFAFDKSFPYRGIEVVVKWSNEVQSDGFTIYEVGCEVRKTGVDLKSSVENWNVNNWN